MSVTGVFPFPSFLREYPSFLRRQEPKEPLNKSLNVGAFTSSFLRRQEPKTMWTEVPAFAGTTGWDKHPGHGLIQSIPKTFWAEVPAFAGTTGQERVGLNTQVTDLFRVSLGSCLRRNDGVKARAFNNLFRVSLTSISVSIRAQAHRPIAMDGRGKASLLRDASGSSNSQALRHTPVHLGLVVRPADPERVSPCPYAGQLSLILGWCFDRLTRSGFPGTVEKPRGTTRRSRATPLPAASGLPPWRGS